MYVAVKGGERAILNSYRMLDAYRRGDAQVPELTLAQIRQQMPLAVSRVMAEGALYDPQLAALLRDTESKQQQIIERIKAVRKELKSVYLPTDHLDDLERQITANFDRLKETPDPEVFRLQAEALDRLRGAVRVFRGAGSSVQPSLPRERAVRGRVLDDPARATLPGYEGPVKRYYERLADE